MVPDYASEMTDGKVRVSRYVPGDSTWKSDQPTWAFEFPLKDLESAVSVTYLICQDGGSFQSARRCHTDTYTWDYRAALYERIDKSGGPSIGVFLAADAAAEIQRRTGYGRHPLWAVPLP